MADIKIKYTKTERARQKKILKVSLRMLPLFEAMEKLLTSTINTISEKIEDIKNRIEENNESAKTWIAVFNDFWVDSDELISVNEVITKSINIAGVRVQEFQSVDFNVMEIDEKTPLWVDDAIDLLQDQIKLKAEIECLNKQIELLEEELLEVRARVKLFENRRIPNAKTAIRKIGQRLQDDERLSIATAKVLKTKKLQASL